MVDTKVRELASLLNIDPEVAQEIYFESDLFASIDGVDRYDLENELKAISSLQRGLYKANKTLQTHGVLTTTFKIDGYDLPAALKEMEDKVREIEAFGKSKLKEETSVTRANKLAHAVASYVTNLFLADKRKVDFGVHPLDPNESSTPFGRAVADSLEIFKVCETPTSKTDNLTTVNWKWPAKAAFKEFRYKNLLNCLLEAGILPSQELFLNIRELTTGWQIALCIGFCTQFLTGFSVLCMFCFNIKLADGLALHRLRVHY